MRSDPNNAWRIGEDTFDAGRPMWSIVGKNRAAGIYSTPEGGEDSITCLHRHYRECIESFKLFLWQYGMHNCNRAVLCFHL